jgi:hypothetical protein
MVTRASNPDVVAMRKHGAHIWKDVSRGQTFWCFCTSGKDHQSQPKWSAA